MLDLNFQIMFGSRYYSMQNLNNESNRNAWREMKPKFIVWLYRTWHRKRERETVVNADVLHYFLS